MFRPAALPGGRRSAGFTLAELLTTVAVIGIASAVGMPMMSQFVDDAGVSTQADMMLQSLNYTRSEAVKRNTRVTMCRSLNGSACADAASGADWRGGWIVFIDGNTAAVRENSDVILRVQGALPGKGQLLGTGNVTRYVSYTSNGQSRLADGTAQLGTFSSCPLNARGKRRQIRLTAGTGWVGVTTVDPNAVCTA